MLVTGGEVQKLPQSTTLIISRFLSNTSGYEDPEVALLGSGLGAKI